MPVNHADVESIESIIHVAYDVISGPAGKKRDWDRERSLFIPGARLVPTAKNAGDASELEPQMLDIESYIARVESYFEKEGFFEKEVARRTEQFGNIAHVWSTYESRHAEDDAEPFMRGINPESFRGWIVTIYWQHESGENPIPEKYLGAR